MLNQIDHLRHGSSDEPLEYFRRTDMVCGTGIHIKLEFTVQPKCGFKVWVLMFQSPFSMNQIQSATRNVEDNMSDDPTQKCKQGFFHPNRQLLTQLRETENSVEAAMGPWYQQMFQWQNKTYDHLELDQALQRMKITAPYVATIYNRKLVYVNKRCLPRQFTFNCMIPLKTTWKYAPAVRGGIVERRFNPYSDRKVFVMLIVTLIVGGVDDPGQDMHGVDLDRPLACDDLLQPIQYRGNREGSVVSCEYDQPPEDPMDDNSQDMVAGATCSKGKEKEVVDEAIRVKKKYRAWKTPAPDGPSDAGSRDDLHKDNQCEYNAFVAALAQNRRNARAEARECREAAGNDPDGSHVAVNRYGWAKSIVFTRKVIVKHCNYILRIFTIAMVLYVYHYYK